MLADAAVSPAVQGELAPALSEAELDGLDAVVCDSPVCTSILEEMGFFYVVGGGHYNDRQARSGAAHLDLPS
jgi:hypothetical protein